ncbi:MAG: D-glycero-D-manno-heptose 1,7-bisphosphate phosphatase [Actinomycetota bacterium]|nr:D-glycero-D-manno-heptose 1,7-bisphosphate phosphatase [Actinomycetota bacterium]
MLRQHMVESGRAAVFLDRDGVLNEVRMEGAVASTPRTVAELQILPTAKGDLVRLRAAGYMLLVVSNQPDVARGDLSLDAVEQINEALRGALPIDAVYVCPHDTKDGCVCRKPKPGLIHAGAREWGVDLGRSWLIGDRWVDLAAAEAAGVQGLLVERPWSWDATSIGGPPDGLAARFTGDLGTCVDFILAQPIRGRG